MPWAELDSGIASATAIMDQDQQLLQNLRCDSSPLIHFYEWAGDSVTYGYFMDPYRLLNRDVIEKRQLHLARRPTGGGITFHLFDFAFSILVPASHPHFSINTLDNYLFINKLVAEAIHPFTGKVEFLIDDRQPISEACSCFCMAKPTKYDIMLQGCKVGGAAQRRTKQGYLHQGSIFLMLPPVDFLQEVLSSDHQVIEAIQQQSFALLGSPVSAGQLSSARREIKALLAKRFCG